jgi:tetratricopeptide (TPR) repeat protein
MGYEQHLRGDHLAAIPFLKQAIGLDQNFALAHNLLSMKYFETGQRNLARESARKAYDLKDRVTELEKLTLTYFFHRYVEGDTEKAIEVAELIKRTYPRNAIWHNNLSVCYTSLGQLERALQGYQESHRLFPRASTYYNIARTFLRLNHIPESEATCKEAIGRGISSTDIRSLLFEIGAARGDETLIRQQIEWLPGRPSEYLADAWQGNIAAFSGRLAKAKELYHRAASLANRRNFKEAAAAYELSVLELDTQFGNCLEVAAVMDQALAVSRDQSAVVYAARILAVGGKMDKAQALIAELQKESPLDTVVNEIWLPVIQASLELARGNFQKAVDLLQPVTRYERAVGFRAMALRGRAYLGLGDGGAATVEFEKILNNRCLAPLSFDYPLAHVYLARAAGMAGDTAKSKKAYQDFLKLWKDADPDILIFKEAKAENEKLK